jgi:hypothetical protein
VSYLLAPTLSADFARKVPKWQRVLERDLQRVGRVLREGWTPPECEPGRRIVVARDAATLRALCAELRPGADCSLDVETVGLGPTETRLVCWGMSDGALTIVVPWSHESNGLVSYWRDGGEAAVAATNAVFATRRAVTHNGYAFDHIVCGRYGFELPACEDTLNAAHVLESHLPKNLAHVVTQDPELAVPPWKQFEDRGEDIERLWFYCGRDNLYTILRWHSLRKELDTTP